MPFDPLPSPASLVDSVQQIEATLAQKLIDLRNLTFEAASPNGGHVQAGANGTVEIDYIKVDDVALTASNPLDAVKTTCQTVLNNARGASETLMFGLVSPTSSLSLVGLPEIDDATPNWAGFAGSVGAMFAGADFLQTKMASMTFVGSAGTITATVNANLELQSLTGTVPQTAVELGQNARSAINEALWKAKNLLDDYIDKTGGDLDGAKFPLPAVALFATSVLKVNDGVQLKRPDGTFAASANAGATETNFGVDTQVGDIWSRAMVFLRERAHVNGSVRTSGVVTEQNSVVISGETHEHMFIDAPTLALDVAYPNWSNGDISLEPDTQRSAGPGSYANIVVKSRSTLQLDAGVYYCQTFDLEPGATIVLGGPVTLFVSGSIIFRGSIRSQSGDRPVLAVGYTGTQMVSLESRFDGVVVAPFAKVNLASVSTPGHSGAFFANEIEVHQYNTVTHHPGSATQIPYVAPPAPPQPPATEVPTNVAATAGDGRVDLTWTGVSGATSYNVYFGNAPGVSTSSSKLTGVASPFAHTGLSNGTTYYYRVSAVGPGGEGPLSSEASATPQSAAPGVPTGVSATAGNAQVTIVWTAVSGATGYNIYYGTAPGVTKASPKLAEVASPYIHTGRTNGTTYYYAVAAVSPGGESALSAEVSATPGAATGNRVLGFESSGDWLTTSGSLSTVTSPKTEGAAAMQISGNGYAEITNTTALTSADVAVTPTFLVDLFVPTVQPNLYWIGQIQLYVTCPSCAVYNEFAGQQDLTGMTLGTFHTIQIAIAPKILNLMQGAVFSDLTLKIVLNVNQGCGPHLLDNGRFTT